MTSDIALLTASSASTRVSMNHGTVIDVRSRAACRNLMRDISFIVPLCMRTVCMDQKNPGGSPAVDGEDEHGSQAGG